MFCTTFGLCGLTVRVRCMRRERLYSPATPSESTATVKRASDDTLTLTLSTLQLELRAAVPDVHLTWVIQPGPHALVANHPAVDEFVVAGVYEVVALASNQFVLRKPLSRP